MLTELLFAAEFAYHQRIIVTRSGETTLLVRDVLDGQPPKRIAVSERLDIHHANDQGHARVAFHPDGQQIAYLLESGTLRLWHTATHAITPRFEHS